MLLKRGFQLSSKPHLVIVGLMGVGKSTLGKAYADAHGLAYADSDDDIERLFDANGGEVADRWGIEALHEIEAGVLLGALASTTPTVVTAAASIVEKPSVREALKITATTVWLEGDLDETHRRQGKGDHRRLMSRVDLEALAARRRPMFEEVADLRLDANKTPTELTGEMDQFFREASHRQ